jgi:hypothetical protein
MKIKNLIPVLLIGIIIGWFLPHFNSCTNKNSLERGNSITIHDTLKVPTVQYKILPGADYNIDSLINVINQYWKDSLKNMYGKGIFEAKYSKEDMLGKRDYILSSRIPIDPQSQLTIAESFIFPKRTLSLVGSIGSSAALGLKYYLHDSQKYVLVGYVGEEYQFINNVSTTNARLELEVGY